MSSVATFYSNMSEVFYRRLSEDARNLLERDPWQRRLFLDFLGVLEDVLAIKSVTAEPPMFTPEEQETRLSELSESLSVKAGLHDTAAANRQGVFAVDGKDAAKYVFWRSYFSGTRCAMSR